MIMSLIYWNDLGTRMCDIDSVLTGATLMNDLWVLKTIVLLRYGTRGNNTFRLNNFQTAVNVMVRFILKIEDNPS